MKKHTVVAMVGTLALLANLLVPGLAFGQAQTGTATLSCDTTAPTFTIEPAASFNYWLDGVTTTPIVSKSTTQDVFNNPNGSALGNTAGSDYIEIQDTRDPAETDCNNGLTVVLHATDSDTDGYYFDGGDTADYSIPLNTSYFVTSSDNCEASSAEQGDVCFNTTALCGAGNGVPAVACTSSHGTATYDYTGTDFATIGTFTTSGIALGTAANTPADRTILSFANGAELYGKAGLGIAYASTLKAGQPVSTYLMNLEYVLTGV